MYSNKNFSGKLLAFYLVLDPAYDWLSTSSFNVSIGPLNISDLFLLGLMMIMLLYMAKSGFRGYSPDLFVTFNLLLLLHRVIVDFSHELTYYRSYLPRSVFIVVLYLFTRNCRPSMTNWTKLAFWTLGVYLVFAIPQLSSSLLTMNRISSIFNNPNFLAFNLFNIMILIYMFPPRRVGAWFFWTMSLILLLLTKTRSVIISMAWLLLLVMKRNRLIVIPVIFIVVAFFSYADFFRLGSTSEVGSLNGRIIIWQEIISASDKMNLLTGSGTKTIERYEINPYYDALTGKIAGYVQPQNHYLLLLVESGTLGLILWWVQILGYLRDLLKTPKGRVRDSAISFLGALLTIQLLENDIFANPTTVLIMGLALAVGRERQFRICNR